MTTGAEIFYTVSPDLHRMARKEGNEIVELDFEIPGQTPSLWGAIYVGRVVEIQKPLQAAFVDIGLPHPGFLPLREGKLPPPLTREMPFSSKLVVQKILWKPRASV